MSKLVMGSLVSKTARGSAALKKPRCPECGSHNLLFRDSKNAIGCRMCGSRWAKPLWENLTRQLPVRRL